MKIGICTGIQNIQTYAEMGFDYIEASVTALMEMAPEAFEQAAARAREAGISVEATNILFPGGGPIRLVGPEADPAALEEYLIEAVRRAAAVGARVMAFGSGALRARPAGFDPEVTHSQLCFAVSTAAACMQPYGITLALEPLNRGETNAVNTLPEGAALLDELRLPNAALLADFYHMRQIEEPLTHLTDYGPRIAHTHIACGSNRAFPLEEREDQYAAFFQGLKAIGYRGRMSIEGRSQNEFADAERSLRLLRRLAEEYGL